MKSLPMLDLNNLNEAQRRAVTWGRGPLLLLAGPGSGKTFTITKRILYLLERGIPPEEILVITFTKEAAAAMQSRFRQMSNLLLPVHFGTFHSVFYHILLESGGFRHMRLINNSQKKKIMLSVMERYGKAPELSEDAVKALAAVSLYKNTKDRERAAAEMPPPWDGRLPEITAAYTEELRAAEAMDFDDMLFECLRLLEESPKVRRGWQNRFRHILIDEFQDCNPIQYEVLRLLTAKPYNLFAVGDDDQSIYGFRGARPDILRRFGEDFGAERLLLDVNYRCGEEIVRASLSVIGENKDRFPKALRAAETDGETGGLQILAFEDRAAQGGWLLGQASEWIRLHGEDGARCAILFRTNSGMQRTAASLRGAGIPVCMRERGQNIYEHFLAKDIMAYLLLAVGDWRREHLLRIVNRPLRYVSREAVTEGQTFPGIQAYYRSQGQPLPEKLLCLQRQLESLKGMSPALGVRYILRAVGYESFLRTLAKGNREKLSEWRDMAEWLKTDAERFRNAREWAEAQESYMAETGNGAVQSGAQESLCLMTVHGAKGLEFDRVIIPDCNERVFPHGELQTVEQLEEERRIFYVAMTRAKKSLELLYITGDSARSGLPSRFLNPLFRGGNYSASSSVSSISSSNSQLSRYSSNASATVSYSSSASI